MKSHYSAYAVGNSDYIIKTTHPDNPDYTDDRKTWKASINRFCRETRFEGLKIIEWSEVGSETFVIFNAALSGGEMIERSRFLNEQGSWLYVDGEMLTGSPSDS